MSGLTVAQEQEELPVDVTLPYAPLHEPIVVPEEVDPGAYPPIADSSQGAPFDESQFSAMAVPSGVAAGRTPGTFAVSNSGAATYSIPIWTPPGVGDVGLKLSLVYNSRGANGVLGAGWSLSGLSAITRCNKTWEQDGEAPGPVTNTISDRFCLDGQQLKLTSAAGTYGQVNSTYATEIESFSKIAAGSTAVGNGPASFTVTTKNGLVYKYGTTANSRIYAGSTGTIRTWALSEIRDRAGGSTGNSISLAYVNEAQNGVYTNGTYRISSIKYPTTLTGQGPFYEVLFGYSARPADDIPTGYLAGNLVREPNLLSTITIQTVGTATPIKTYNLSYTYWGASQRQVLYRVQECSADNCLRPTSISYQSGQAGWLTPILTAASASTSANAVPIPADLNGDGRTDLVYPVRSASCGSLCFTVDWWAVLANASGYGTPINTTVTNVAPSKILVASFSGKQQAQLLRAQSGYWQVGTYNGGAFDWANTGVPVAGEFQAADYDGDGLPDLASVNASNQILVRRNLTVPPGPVSFANTAQVVASAVGYFPIEGEFLKLTTSADFNGDGRADFVTGGFVDDGSGNFYRWYIHLSGGFGVPATTSWVYGSASTTPLTADWNADGCTDLLSGAKVYISNCAGGFSSFTGSLPGSQGPMMAADWNSDGRTDLIYSRDYTWYVARSTGAGMATGVTTQVAAPSGTAWFVFDQDGDGQVDLGFRDTNGQLKYRLHAAAGEPPGLATSFTDGFGINQSPTYVSIAVDSYTKQTSAVFPEVDYAGPLYVVDQFTASTGTGAGSTYQNQFWYFGARVHVQGRGFEGFQRQRIYDTRNGLFTHDYVGRAFPYTGMHLRRLVRQSDDATVVHDWDGTTNSQSLGTGIQERRFPFIASLTDKHYQFGGSSLYDGTLITQVTTTNTYGDGYGNVTNQVTTVTDKDSGSPFFNSSWSRTVTTTYSNSAANNCFGLPNYQEIEQTAPGQAPATRTTDYTVDSSKCRITIQVIEPNIPALKVATTLGFDTCGNVNSIQVVGSKPDGTSMSQRTTAFDYDDNTTRCQLPEKVTDALGNSTKFNYDYSFGVPTRLTDPNGLATNWGYDDFGRRTSETRPDGTSTAWAFDSCSVDPCWGVNNLRFLVYETELNTTGGQIRQRQLFYDGFDRLRYDESDEHLLGTWTTDRLIAYDSLGRPTHDYRPRVGGASNGYRKFDYDPLNRVTAERLTIQAARRTVGLVTSTQATALRLAIHLVAPVNWSSTSPGTCAASPIRRPVERPSTTSTRSAT
jgi:YD repeat-containing protein